MLQLQACRLLNASASVRCQARKTAVFVQTKPGITHTRGFRGDLQRSPGTANSMEIKQDHTPVFYGGRNTRTPTVQFKSFDTTLLKAVSSMARHYLVYRASITA